MERAMPSDKIIFTKTSIKALPTPENKRAYYADEKTRGFGLSVTPHGTKTFFVYRKINGTPQRTTIGHFPDVTVDQARKKAQELIGVIATGADPQDARRASRGELTFGGLFQEYLTRHAKVHKKTWKEDERQYKAYLKGWARRKLSSIKRTDVQTTHVRIGKDHGKYQANRVLATLKSVFNLARDWGFFSGDNPATGVKRFTEKSRERRLQPDELPRFFQALNEEPDTTPRDYVFLSLLTGARQENVLAMRWDEINWEAATWAIPEIKTGEPQTVPLVPEAISLLQERKQNVSEDFVFPSTGKTGHFVEPRKAWARLLKRAEIKNLRLHDLRRTLGSWQADMGASLSVIGKSLGHKNIATTAIYARLSLNPVRTSMENATSAILESGGMKPKPEPIANKE